MALGWDGGSTSSQSEIDNNVDLTFAQTERKLDFKLIVSNNTRNRGI